MDDGCLKVFEAAQSANKYEGMGMILNDFGHWFKLSLNMVEYMRKTDKHEETSISTLLARSTELWAGPAENELHTAGIVCCVCGLCLTTQFKGYVHTRTPIYLNI